MTKSRSFWGGLLLALGLLLSLALRQGWIDVGALLTRHTERHGDAADDMDIDLVVQMARLYRPDLAQSSDAAAPVPPTTAASQSVGSTPTLGGGRQTPDEAARRLAQAERIARLMEEDAEARRQEESRQPAAPPRTAPPAQTGQPVPPRQPVRPEGKVSVLYKLQRTANGLTNSTAGQIINRSGILGQTADYLNHLLVMPRDLVIRVEDCGVVNAFYDPSNSSIIICDELFYWMSRIFPQDLSAAELQDAILGATLFFTFHEVGHALIDLYDAPVLAAEEDAADALATVLLAHGGLADVAFTGAASFSYMAAARDPNAPLLFWDEHSLDEQRFFNILCYLYAEDPGRFAFVVAERLLPLQRAQVCPSRYARTQRAVGTILGPHIRGR